MKTIPFGVLTLAMCGAVLLVAIPLTPDEKPRTGPQTEKRFPPLRVPPGFKATLFACDPLIEYPSAIAAGPRAGAVFVAVDYMTGLGTDIVRRDEIRLVEDVDGDGYADKATVYAGQFNSIQGMSYHDGTVYAMHAPFLTALRDTDGDGKADERRDLLTGLGLTPEKNPVRLHCANGVVMGHDGWLYLALGDNGCDVPRPEGDRLVHHGGAILRCRPDGRDLHVFAMGLRNIYDVALDEESNVFTRDNENDGGDYKIRVCHSMFGADHGYPYHYYERPDEALPPLADLGLGSSAGGLFYLEAAFSAEYRGNLFFCEWGRAVVRYRPERAGSAFAPLKEIEFASGATDDPYGFKPTDLAVQRDGALMVADWADGQRPKRGRGRIYRIAPLKSEPPPRSAAPDAGLEAWVAQLDSTRHHLRLDAQATIEHHDTHGLAAIRAALAKKRLGVRGRMHAVWILARLGGSAAVAELLSLAQTDPDPRVQAQAVRAVADLSDPVLVKHRLDAEVGDAALAEQLGALATGRDPRVLLEVVIALGRLRWHNAPTWLGKHLVKPDAALAHAAMQTLRRGGNWPAVLKLLDEPATNPLRLVALRALAERFEPLVVDGLIDRVRAETDPSRRREYADALTRVHRKPGPWVYWGYRPPPRPANTVAWERTEAIEQALDRVLADPDRTVRLAVLRRMQREKVPIQSATLGSWLREEREAEPVAALLQALRDHPTAAPLLTTVVQDRRHAPPNRLTALAMLVAELDETSERQLLELAGRIEDGPVLAELLRQTGLRPRLKAARMLLGKTGSPDPLVRAAALEALAELRAAEATEPVRALLADKDARVRRAAADAAGKLGMKAATDALLNLARDADPMVRRASLTSLHLFKEPRVVPLAVLSLSDPTCQMVALQCISELGGPDQLKAVVDAATHNPSAEVLPLALRTLTRWSNQDGNRRVELDRAAAELQGTSGILGRWNAIGPLSEKEASSLRERLAAPPKAAHAPPDARVPWQTVFAAGTEARVRPGPGKGSDGATLWLAHTDLFLAEQTPVQFLASAGGTLRVWLNGRQIHQRDEVRTGQPDADRFDGTLEKGLNRVLIQLGSAKGNAEFHVRFRRKSGTAAQERLIQTALARPGNAERGRKLFFDAARTLCIKCHRIGDEGERIGPELTGVGSRFSRIYLIESILEPGRTIAPGYETLLVAMKDGRVLVGTRVDETADTLTLGDNKGEKLSLDKARIEERRTHPLSTMPDGLEKPLTAEEFTDLIAFLVSQKK